MPFVLANQKQWPKDAFKFEILHTFQNLRDGVNKNGKVADADAFMWEIFTTKKYYDIKEIKQIGQIYTPWPSWVITASTDVLEDPAKTLELQKFLDSVNEGVEYFDSHHDEAVKFISTNLDYTADDARAWLKTVQFVPNVKTIDVPTVIDKTISILKSSGALDDTADDKQFYRLV